MLLKCCYKFCFNNLSFLATISKIYIFYKPYKYENFNYNWQKKISIIFNNLNEMSIIS